MFLRKPAFQRMLIIQELKACNLNVKSKAVCSRTVAQKSLNARFYYRVTTIISKSVILKLLNWFFLVFPSNSIPCSR